MYILVLTAVVITVAIIVRNSMREKVSPRTYELMNDINNID